MRQNSASADQMVYIQSQVSAQIEAVRQKRDINSGSSAEHNFSMTLFTGLSITASLAHEPFAEEGPWREFAQRVL